MLEVTSIVPSEGTEDFYIDAPLNITFSAEVSDTSLNAMIFVLYEQYDKTGGGYTYQAVGTNPIKSQSDVKKIILSPLVNLKASQDHVLMILGDRDTGDGTPQGILSTTGDIMDGNFTLNFQTGTKTAPSTDVDPIVVPGDDLSDDFDTDEELTDPDVLPTKLQIVSVEPTKLFDVATIGELTVKFNELIEVTQLEPFAIDGFNIDSEGDYIPLETRAVEIASNEIKLHFKGVECVSGDYIRLPDATVSGELNDQAPMPLNHKYKISFLRSKIRGMGSHALMDENGDVEITTKLFPKFGNAYEARITSKGLLGNNVSDELIEMTLRNSTKFILDRIKWSYGPCLAMDTIDRALYNYLKQYVICKSIFDIAGTTHGGVGSITNKSLGDFSIGYGKDDGSSDLSKIQDCMAEMYDLIMAFLGKGVKSATKSAGTTHYPGRRETRRLSDPNAEY